MYFIWFLMNGKASPEKTLMIVLMFIKIVDRPHDIFNIADLLQQDSGLNKEL